ncbi:MAG: bifunctional 5,10-methylenetetrahydrofolate dehydrogenase/5,10-methenyltetrahydrofolate cyclohydrolase [Clostridiales bacterium]|nr:bifunctional 5,10-methylenetetrahydrofolate dehydrogenase/5,10-methenyltetrahydrofolate cyclohydrolase [Clostridiales bacterium]
MSAKLLLGKPVADSISEKVIAARGSRHGTLCTIGFVESEAWLQYSNSLKKSASNFGFECNEVLVTATLIPELFCETVEDMCRHADVTGVIVQQPLSKDYANAVNFVPVDKDVDCINPLSIAKLYKGGDGLYPATPLAVLRLLDFYNIDLQGKHVVIVGRGNAVGKPLALMALQRNATVTVCHTKTVDLPAICRNADVLISACGVAGLITKDFVTSNTVVIDVGLSFVNGKTCGDVAKEVYDVVAAVSPVPGGVGPVTRATLFENLCKALNNQK